MSTITHTNTDFSNLKENLSKIANKIYHNENLTQVRQDLEELVTSLNKKNPSEKLIGLIFSKALGKKLSLEKIDQETNLYLNKSHGIQMIDLFNVLASQVPFVAGIAKIANYQILKTMTDLKDPCIIDIGIGTGRQMVTILEQLAKDDSFKNKTLTIVGVEPNKDFLNLAEKNIQEASKKLNISVKFIPICNCVEELKSKDWDVLKQFHNPIVNASFALHHIKKKKATQTGLGRNGVLKSIAELAPSIFILSEPNIDHYNKDFITRFKNCYEHFSNVFEIIDSLEVNKEIKEGIKINFFANEILDIIGNDNDKRVERHEATSSWMNRLNKAGFKSIVKDSDFSNEQLQTDTVGIKTDSDYYEFYSKITEFPLTSVMCVKLQKY